MASSVYTAASEAPESLSDAQRLIEQLRAQLAEEVANRARLERSLRQLDVPIQHVGDSVQFLGDAFDELIQLFHGYRDALISLRSTHTPAAALLAGLREMETVCDLEFLESEVPNVCARSRVAAEQLSELVRAIKEFAKAEAPSSTRPEPEGAR
jgi:hypothetical protein